MTYSLDLRERAIRYVTEGGSKTEAARLFGIHRQTLHHWLRTKDQPPKRHVSRHRKLDKAALAAHVRDYPDAFLRERAEHFGVHVNAIWVALRKLDIRKKNDALCGDKSQ